MCLMVKTTAAVQKFNYRFTKHVLNLCTELNVLKSTLQSEVTAQKYYSLERWGAVVPCSEACLVA